MSLNIENHEILDNHIVVFDKIFSFNLKMLYLNLKLSSNLSYFIL